MALLVPDEGEVEMLSRILNVNAADDVVLHLYVNDVTPGEGDTVSTYTECSAAGYAAITLAAADWSIATSSGVTTAEQPQKTFSLTEASTDYGYYVTNNDGTKLLWAERFSDAPHDIPSGGGKEEITVKIQLD